MEEITRRSFFGESLALTSVLVASENCFGGEESFSYNGYPITRIASLSSLNYEIPIAFSYLCDSMGLHFLVKLKSKCHNGVGRYSNIVAFHGINIENFDYWLNEHFMAIGPQIYDLTDDGQVVAGACDTPLTGVKLSIVGNEIYAIGYNPIG